MRKDMAKVIVERPRRGGSDKRPGRRLPDDQLPSFQGMKQAHRDQKELNENLAPLRRFIEKQVGRPWNSVFSELRENIKPGNTVQEHVLSHVGDFVAVNVSVVSPSDRYPCGLRNDGPWIHSVYEGNLYVDPQDGIVKAAKRRVPARAPTSQRSTLIRVDAQRVAVQSKGLWYSVLEGHFKTETYSVKHPQYKFNITHSRFLVDGQRLDVISDNFLGLVRADRDEVHRLRELYGAVNIYGIHRSARKLSSKDLKRLSLEDHGSEL